MKLRKLLSILLVLMLIIGLLSMQANAILIIEGARHPQQGDKLVFYSTDPWPPSDTTVLQHRDFWTVYNENIFSNASDFFYAYMLQSGQYYLRDNYTPTVPIVIAPDADVTICLYGKILDFSQCTNLPSIIVSSGATLTIEDCALGYFLEENKSYNTLFEGTEDEITVEGGAIINGYKSVVWVDSEGTFNLESGTIAGGEGYGYGAGGVQVYKNAVFNMNGGLIYNNNTTYSGGGGVDVWDGAVFNMNGGTISGNTSEAGGGGVTIRKYDDDSATGGTMNMNGGTISGNSTEDDAGGIRIGNYCTLNMKGGTISGNSSNTTAGGVNVASNADFTMDGGTISGNSSNSGAGGVRVGINGDFTMNDGTIEKNTAETEGGGVKVNGNFTMNGGKISENTLAMATATDADTYRLGGGVYAGSNSTFTMNGGYIVNNINDGTKNNYASDVIGGGVFNRGTFNLRGGEISGNRAKSGVIGGVANYSSAALNISGNPKVKNNDGWQNINNIVHYSNDAPTTFVTVDGALTDGAELHIDHCNTSFKLATGEFATGTESYTITDSDSDKFYANPALPGIVARTGNALSVEMLGEASLTGSVTGSNKSYTYSYEMNATGYVKGVFIVALYDSQNKLVDFKTTEMTAATSKQDSGSITTATEATRYKIMFWGNLNGMKPLCESAYGNISKQ